MPKSLSVFETNKIYRVIDSCNDTKQLDTCNSWIENINISKYSEFTGIDFKKYISYKREQLCLK